MTDISLILPTFPTAPYAHLIAPLERAGISTSQLLCATPSDIAKQAQVPPTAAARLIDAVISALHESIVEKPLEEWRAISFLDPVLDQAWNGGAPTRYLTEITGESGIGKTQFLLTLLLAVQLPPSLGGLSKSALYISTEASLSTSRLSQLLSSHPRLCNLPELSKPSLSRIHAIQVPDLEAQEHILRFQVPVAIKRYNVGLLIIDSIASNYRAEMDVLPAKSALALQLPQPAKASNSIAILGERRAHLVKLGTLLRDLAREHGIAIVCSNQVADRFERGYAGVAQAQQIVASSMPAAASASAAATVGSIHECRAQATSESSLSLDHQQRFFTGWGDRPFDVAGGGAGADKTPALGLVWSNQIAARVALVREGRATMDSARPRRRWMRIVFASWTGQTAGRGVEYEISAQGVKAVVENEKPDKKED